MSTALGRFGLALVGCPQDLPPQAAQGGDLALAQCGAVEEAADEDEPDTEASDDATEEKS